jgi:predicted transport protein
MGKISLKDHKSIKERNVQYMIAKDPYMLGLGELKLIDIQVEYENKERLDLLFQSKDLKTIYEVEIQLGQLDGSHLFRTVEYWLNERDNKLGHKHVAVLIAEVITKRALEIIKLCMCNVSIVILEMTAYESENGILYLKFKEIYPDECAIVDEYKQYEEYEEIVLCDRQYYENNAPAALLNAADTIFRILKEIDPVIEMNYTQGYIGFKTGKIRGLAFIVIKQDVLILKLVLKNLAETETKIKDMKLDLIGYAERKEKKCGEYKIRLTADDVKNKEAALKELLNMVHEYNTKN